LTSNWLFVGINIAMCGAQTLIVFVGGAAFNINQPAGEPPQYGSQWAIAIVIGFVSIPIGALIRLIPDSLIRKCIPDYFKRKSRKLPGFTITDEERFDEYPEAFTDVRDELVFLKKLKGGRLNNLKFAVKHPREIIAKARSPSHSRSNSVREPQTPTREDSLPSPAQTPESRARSRSNRSRSNSALGAPTVMAGIIAGSVAATWSPVEKTGPRDFNQPPRATPSPLSNRTDEQEAATVLTEEPQEMEGGPSSDVPRLNVPQPPSKPSVS
jgi:P-type Ca2+ transporter type 2C